MQQQWGQVAHYKSSLPTLTNGDAVGLLVDVNGKLLVSTTISGLADAIADGAAVDVTDTGHLALGTDGSNYQILSTDSSGRLILGAGTNAIGKLAANSGVDIGDVDILSIAAGDNNIGNVDIVTVPADPFGVNADAASTTGSISAKLRSLATNLGAVVAGSELQVDIVGALPAGTAAIGKLAANSGVDIGDVDVTSISAGSNNIGNVGIIPRTSGGMTIFRSIDIDETEEEVKATAGQLFSIIAMNKTAAPLYLKFYNATAANVSVGTTTPVLTIPVPANADSDVAGFVWNNEIGFAFGTAITVACTTGVADNDTGAPGANDCVINLGYA